MADPEKINSLHILTDRKFLPWIKKTFSTSSWTAYYIVLNVRARKLKTNLDENTTEVSTDQYGQDIILQKLKTIDIAFHYLLDNTKADIIYHSAPNVLHCWCFYGAELYQQSGLFRKELYGPYTSKMLWGLPEIKFRYDFRAAYYLFRLIQTPVISLRKAIPRIHSILWYIPEEIERLKNKINLPPWKYFQFFNFEDIIPAETNNTNTHSKGILVGNSATAENNHLDVLHYLNGLEPGSHTYLLPLSYGQFPRYKAKIKARYSRQLADRVSFLENYLPLNEYYALLQQYPTAIFLHYRQQGLGNILYLLYTGTKVYLSKRNVVFEWLKRNQVEVFIFEEEFKADYQNDRLILDQETAERNKTNIKALLDHERNAETISLLERNVLEQRKKYSNKPELSNG